MLTWFVGLSVRLSLLPMFCIYFSVCVDYCEKFLCVVDRVSLYIILDNDQLDTHLLYFTIRLL